MLTAHHPARNGLAALLVDEMHVDGFRFDLAPVLAREMFDVTAVCVLRHHASGSHISRIKLIAEPWDVGPRYQVGNFPVRWTEWNGKYATPCESMGVANRVSRRDGESSRRFERHLFRQRSRRVREHQLHHAHDGFTLAIW